MADDYDRITRWIFNSSKARRYIKDDYTKTAVFLKDLERLESSEAGVSTMIKNYGTGKGGDGRTLIKDYIDDEQITPNNTKWQNDTISKIQATDSEDKLLAIKSQIIDPNENNYEDATVNAVGEIYTQQEEVVSFEKPTDDAIKEADRGNSQGVYDLYQKTKNPKTKQVLEGIYYNSITAEKRGYRDSGDLDLLGKINQLEDLKDSIEGPDTSELRADVQDTIDRLNKRGK